MIHAFKLRLEVAVPHPGFGWIMAKHLDDWCNDNLTDYEYVFIGEDDINRYTLSFYWLLVKSDEDATLLKLTFGDDVVRIALPADQ